MLIVLPLALAACSGSTPSVEDLNLQRPAASLTQECPRPVSLPERVLTQAEVEDYWLVDRRNLLNCRSRHAALAEQYEQTLATVLGTSEDE